MIGCLGVISVVTLTGITLASNFGTFVLYALTLSESTAYATKHQHNIGEGTTDVQLLFEGRSTQGDSPAATIRVSRMHFSLGEHP